MLVYPDIDPVAISLGSWNVPWSADPLVLQIRWYGISYLAAFLIGWFLARRRARQAGSGFAEREVEDIVFYIILGVLIGGKLGYALFYQTDRLFSDPLSALNFMKGGMSFHGGFIGVMVSFWLYAKSTGRTFLQVTDFLAPMFPIGMGFGRLGNFINGELWGRPTDVPWGMVFPHVDDLPRHPNQLYQAFGEGVVLFALLWWYSSRPRPRGAVSGLFVLAYGVYRFLIEFVREPDRLANGELRYFAFDWLTMGQALSVPMVLIGAGLMFWAYRRESAADAAQRRRPVAEQG